MDQKTVLIAGGATGGHIFPAYALGKKLAVRVHIKRVVYFLPERARRFHADDQTENVCYEYVCDLSFSPNLISFICRFVKLFFAAQKIMGRHAPSVVVCFGSLISLPLVCVALLRGIPVVLHEQNMQWGKTNRLLAPFAQTIAVSFPPDKKGSQDARIAYTGNLLREEISSAADAYTREAYSPKGERKTILILGGSQGAQAINAGVVAMLEAMDRADRNSIRVVHILGDAEDYGAYETRYAQLDIEHTLYAYHTTMADLYAEADVVISRAGAGTLCELMAFGIPSILIPYPYAAKHQYKNAAYLADNGAALVLEQDRLSPEILGTMLLRVCRNAELYATMRVRARKLFRSDGVARLADSIMAFV